MIQVVEGVLHQGEEVVEVPLQEVGVEVVPLNLEVVVGEEVHPLEEVEEGDHLSKEVVEEGEGLLMMEEEVVVEHQVEEVVEVLLL